jgi:hypothetical protein
MNTALLRSDRERANRRRPHRATDTRPEWIETAEAGILYFGVTLMPLLLAILLYQFVVIG